MKFDQIKQAYKRAQHFALSADGEYTVTGQTGACIAARNYALLLDAIREDDFVGEISVLDMWAQSLNRLCEKQRIEDDPIAKNAFGSFLSRIPFDPLKL